MRQAGEVTYADAHNDVRGEGIVEFASRKDMEKALDMLDGCEFNGKNITLIREKDRRYRAIHKMKGIRGVSDPTTVLGFNLIAFIKLKSLISRSGGRKERKKSLSRSPRRSRSPERQRRVR